VARSFDPTAAGDDRTGAALEAGRHPLEAGLLDPPDNHLRQRRSRDIEVFQRLTEQRVADRAADNARLLALAIEHGEHAGERAVAKPGHVEAALCRGHFGLGTVRPGTKLPFSSTCAGI